MDRKAFLRTAGSAALFAALGITFSSCNVSDSGTGSDNNNGNNNGGGSVSGIVISGNTITLNLAAAEISNLRSAGGWRLINQANTLVVNIDGTLFRAFSSFCPHRGCNDSWQYASNRFRCTCHNSVFENTGVLVSGPATSNLIEFGVNRTGDIVTITTG